MAAKCHVFCCSYFWSDSFFRWLLVWRCIRMGQKRIGIFPLRSLYRTSSLDTSCTPIFHLKPQTVSYIIVDNNSHDADTQNPPHLAPPTSCMDMLWHSDTGQIRGRFVQNSGGFTHSNHQTNQDCISSESIGYASWQKQGCATRRGRSSLSQGCPCLRNP